VVEQREQKVLFGGDMLQDVEEEDEVEGLGKFPVFLEDVVAKHSTCFADVLPECDFIQVKAGNIPVQSCFKLALQQSMTTAKLCDAL